MFFFFMLSIERTTNFLFVSPNCCRLSQKFCCLLHSHLSSPQLIRLLRLSFFVFHFFFLDIFFLYLRILAVQMCILLFSLHLSANLFLLNFLVDQAEQRRCEAQDAERLEGKGKVRKIYKKNYGESLKKTSFFFLFYFLITENKDPFHCSRL